MFTALLARTEHSVSFTKLLHQTLIGFTKQTFTEVFCRILRSDFSQCSWPSWVLMCCKDKSFWKKNFLNWCRSSSQQKQNTAPYKLIRSYSSTETCNCYWPRDVVTLYHALIILVDDYKFVTDACVSVLLVAAHWYKHTKNILTIKFCICCERTM